MIALFNAYLSPLIKSLFSRNFSDSIFILKRILYRIFEINKKNNRKLSLEWCSQNSSKIDILIENKEDRLLFKESENFHKTLKKVAGKKIKNIGITMGGGGHYLLLYFLTRKLKPNVVVETGVALGFSSNAILEALLINGKGSLYSSDYPYLTFENSTLFIGHLVDEYLKNNWKLFLNGDKKNLDEINNLASSIDLFHYDSDKSYLGRYFTMNSIKKKLHKHSVIIMDDIQDNLFFFYFFKESKCDYLVFEFEGKFCGIITGNLSIK